jgi:hypothetical protein
MNDDSHPHRARKLLVVCCEPPVAGAPAARLPALAACLTGVEVTLAMPADRSVPGAEHVSLLYYAPDGSALEAALSDHDALLVEGFALHRFSWLGTAKQPLAVDLAKLSVLGDLAARRRDAPDSWRGDFAEALRILNELVRAGDFFLCDSESQRELCLGLLLANHRVNPHTAQLDPDLRRLIAVVQPDPGGVEPLRAFCDAPARAPDHGFYLFDAERVAADRARAIESLLEFNYWHESSVARGEVIVGLEAQVRDLRAAIAELETRLASVQQPAPGGLLARARAWLERRTW